MKTTVDVLREAKAYLSDPRRWNRSGGFRCDGPYGEMRCAQGAIISASDGSLAMVPACTALGDAIGQGTYYWNDNLATHEELIDAFDRAIIAESAKLAGEGIASRDGSANPDLFRTDAPSPVEVAA